ncbi:hypothetical protein CYMTET_36348, partial [Cymbomonas tetramitiformis]
MAPRQAVCCRPEAKPSQAPRQPGPLASSGGKTGRAPATQYADISSETTLASGLASGLLTSSRKAKLASTAAQLLAHPRKAKLARLWAGWPAGVQGGKTGERQGSVRLAGVFRLAKLASAAAFLVLPLYSGGLLTFFAIVTDMVSGRHLRRSSCYCNKQAGYPAPAFKSFAAFRRIKKYTWLRIRVHHNQRTRAGKVSSNPGGCHPPAPTVHDDTATGHFQGSPLR